MRRARGLLETHCQRRVGARGLQRSIEIASFGKPGCLAVRVIKLDSSQTQSNRCGGGEAGLGNVGRVALEEDRPRLDPLHEPLSGKWPPLPDPLLHKCVEEREMERRARIHGFNARSFSGTSDHDSFHEHESKREPPHPDPLLHKYVEEREMERTK